MLGTSMLNDVPFGQLTSKNITIETEVIRIKIANQVLSVIANIKLIDNPWYIKTTSMSLS